MARVTPESNPAIPDVAPDALSLLTRDHRLADELFAEFQRAAPQQLDPLARRICKMLRVHAQIEEELFYPAARRALADPELIDVSERQHADIKQLIVHVESMTSDHPEFKRAMAQLAETVASHAQKEEQEVFTQLRNASGTPLDLVAIGIALAERRDTLLDVLGLHGDDEEGAANQRETRQPSSERRTSTRAP